MRKRASTQFNCFSPPVMLATLLIETTLAAYTLIRYRLDTAGRLIVLAVLSLAIFQLAEYHVCTGYGITAQQWSRLGYVAITTLPALGLHMLYLFAQRPGRRLVWACYATMVGCMTYFLTYHAAFIGYKCTGNYVIFQIGIRPAIAYATYYYGWLLTAIGLGARWVTQLLKAGRKHLVQVQTIRALITGYMVFLVPTAVSNTVKPSTTAGIPSIMCGFAVLFAIILVGYIVPRLEQPRLKKSVTVSAD